MVAWPGSEVTTGARRRLVAWIGAVAAVLMLVAGAAALWWRPASVQPAAIPGPALQPAPTASAPASPPRSAPVRAPQRAEAPKPAPQAVPPAAPAPVAAPPTAAPAPAAAPEPSRQAEAPASAPALPADPAEAFAALEKQGGIIADAKSAPELYHNARVLEERGDADAARRAYAAVAALGLDFIDPHLRYAALLGTRDGRAGARAAYAEIVREHPARPAALVHALQFDGAERRAKVDAVAAENPDYGPAQYLVADEHSQDRLGAQTLTERRLEFEALDAFLEADAEGRLKPFFLDGSVLAQWLTRARDRKAAVEAFFQATPTQPTATFARSGSGWTGTLTIPEPATTIAVRVGDSGEFKPTGFLPGKDARTGKPAPRPSFALPAAQERATVYVTYDDTTGHTAGPFPIAFDPQAALVAAEREVLERSSASWILFRADMANVIDFGRLIRNRCAIAKVELGYDDGPLEIELPLPSCDEKHPDAMPADAKPNLSVPKGTRSVAVQLTYADGAQSEVKTFRR
jgi:hypothetical protein